MIINNEDVKIQKRQINNGDYYIYVCAKGKKHDCLLNFDGFCSAIGCKYKAIQKNKLFNSLDDKL